MADDQREIAIQLFNQIADDIGNRRLRVADMGDRFHNRMAAMKQTRDEATRRKTSDWWTSSPLPELMARFC
jgi:hypothetical protein